MLYLPALRTSDGCRRLPLSDAGAARLAATLLKPEDSQNTAELASALRVDPPLALWCWSQAVEKLETPPRTLPALADWLVPNLLQLLREDFSPIPPSEGPSDELKCVANQAGETFRLATIAAALADAQPDGPAADEAFLAAQLSEFETWWQSVPAVEAGQEQLPVVEIRDRSWSLVEDCRGAIDEARQILSGSSPPPADHFDGDQEELRRQAEEVRDRFAQQTPCAGELLHALIARLAQEPSVGSVEFARRLEEEKLEAMAEFAAGAGHEINNPAAVIAGRAQLLLKDETHPERRRELALINVQAKRIHEMIADMILFARPPQPRPEVVELTALVDQVFSELAAKAQDREILLIRCGAAGAVKARVDPVQFQVALRAMCDNALFAIGRSGRIEVELRTIQDGADPEVVMPAVEIIVRDDGPGIPDDVRRHLFDPYYSGRAAGRGLGLGLAKCWKIIRNHSGTIEVKTSPREGATFTIRVPVNLELQEA